MFLKILLLVALIGLNTCVGNANQVSIPNSTLDDEHSHLKVTSIIFGLSKLASEQHLSRECFSELKSIERGVIDKAPWAMKVLDSSGVKDSGFIWGQNYWLGSPEGCAAVQSPLQITLSNRYERNMKDGLLEQTAPFEMDYRVAHIKHDSPWQVEAKFMTERILHVGLCLPSSCSSTEIENLTQTVLNENVLMKFYDLRAEVLYVKDLKLKDSFFNKLSYKIFTGVVIFTLAMMVAARFVTDEDKDGGLITFIKCFDVVSNGRALFTVEGHSPDSVPVIDGLRTVACFWIILPHVSWFMHFTMNNKAFFIYYAEKLPFQYFSPAMALVDVFFTISGFLQTYNFMRNKEQFETIRQNTLGANFKTFGRMLFHRYLRLAPVFLVMMLVVELSTVYTQDVSVFYLHERFDQYCSDYWWRNIIFIQNFFDNKKMCLSWSWSLACDMQYFCLISALLFLYTKHPRVVKKIVACGILAVVAWTYYSGLKCGYKISLDVSYQTGTEMYSYPVVRIVPYLLGSISGWWLAQNKGQFKMGATVEKCVWSLASTLFLMCIFTVSSPDRTTVSTISLITFGRFSFSMAVSWMIIGSAAGRGCWWSRILENKFFQHFSRLSYAIYFLNPIVITTFFGLSNSSFHADPLMLYVLTFGFMVIVYIGSIPLALAFEMPYSNWSSALKKKTRKSKVS